MAIAITLGGREITEEVKWLVGFNFHIAKELVPWSAWNAPQRVMCMVNMPVHSPRLPHDISL